MKYIFTIISLIFCSHLSFGQLQSGPLFESGRKMLSTIDFKIEHTSISGVIYLEISVNNKGIVTSARRVFKEGSLTSVIAELQAANYLKKLIFQEGTYFPQYHNGIIKVTFVKLS